MVSRVLAVAMLVLCACGHRHHETVDGGADSGAPADACESLQCQQVNCGAKGLPPTTLTGTVFAPNGTLPLYGVTVYVPASDPGALAPGLVCDQCSQDYPGGALASTTTDEAGNFALENVPATANVPVVIQVGKWRRQLVIPNVAACQPSPVDAVDTTLPKSYMDATPNTAKDASGNPKVDMPKIAISTGGADALECLPVKLGVDPSEITTSAGAGHVHLYSNFGAGSSQGANKFTTNWAGSSTTAGDSFTDAQVMWGDLAHLSAYDIVMFSCEGAQFVASKPQTALDAVKQYADMGGRVFMSHWHNIWIGGTDPTQLGGLPAEGIPAWQAIVNFNFAAPQNDASQLAVIDETVPKGMSFATWMLNVGGSTVRDQVAIDNPRYTLQSADATQSERLVWVDPAQELSTSNPAGETSIQDVQLTTPVEVPDDQKCGKVVFSDMHVASGSVSTVTIGNQAGTPYPTGCSATPLSPQEKALAFIFFDIASCVGVVE